MPVDGEFKLAIVGDSGVGKSSWIWHHLMGEFSEEYRPSLEIGQFPLAFNTTHGSLIFYGRDIPGNALHTPRFDANESMGNIDCAIVMFDLSKPSTKDNVVHWYHMMTSVNDTEIPIALIGNKVDLVDGNEVMESEITSWVPEGDGPVKYYETSSKDPGLAAFEEPFMWLLQRLLNSETPVEFVPVCYMPIQVHTDSDMELFLQAKDEMRRAANSPLPDGSDDD